MATIKIGMKFHRWTVKSKGKLVGHNRYWICICKCGVEKEVCYSSLTSGTSKSCGCFSAQQTSKRNKTHGQSKTRDYSIWTNMTQRCRDENSGSFKNYGGRGIKVCKRWLSFENFIADMGPSKGRTIERINNDLGYFPQNCKWASRKEQSNNKRSNVFIEFNGKTLTVRQWSIELGIAHTTLWNRLNTLNWPVEKAFNQSK